MSEPSQQVFPAVANDLMRDRWKIVERVAQIEGALGAVELCIIAPRHGGQLNGGTFYGLPVVEGDVTECIVGIGYRQP